MSHEQTFEALFAGLSLWFSYESHCEVCIYPGVGTDVWDASLDRLHHEWFARLVAPDLACVHAGLFEHFSKEPTRIKSLQWRALEELVGSVFEANGFTIKLGPGRADEGIDLRLLEHSVYGDLITTVQVKSGGSPVRLHYVQALAAAGDLDGAHESLFVSSSRFLPGVYKWVERWNRERVQTMKLATASDVAEWCAAAEERTWTASGVLRDPLPRGSGSLVGKILSAPNQVRFVYDRYALVLRQTQGAVLLRQLETKGVSGDALTGMEVPVLPTQPPTPDELFAARLCPSADGWAAMYWGDDAAVYSEWEGKPSWFDHLD